MCYAKPGPRCYGHASEKLENTKAKLAATEETVQSLEQEAEKIARKHSSNYKTRYDYKELQKKYSAAQLKAAMLKRELKTDTLDADATLGGIEALQERKGQLFHGWEPDSEEYMAVNDRLYNARKEYARKLLAYDHERGTVHGRNPSPYGSDKGLMILRKRKKALMEKIDSTSGEKQEKYKERLAALSEQIHFAVETKEHVQRGITDAPSANLASNKEQLKEANVELVKAQKAHAEGQAAYRSGPVKAVNEFTQAQKAAGHVYESKWPAADKRKIAELEMEAEVFWEEKVKPSMYRTRQFEAITEKLEKQIALGSITAKERARNKQKGMSGSYNPV